MSTIHLPASELAPVVHVIATYFDGSRGTLRHLDRAAAVLAPALTANAREYSTAYGAPVTAHTATDLLAACTVSYCQHNSLRADTKRALRALGSLRYNGSDMTAEEQAAMLDAYMMCARVAVDMLSNEG